MRADGLWIHGKTLRLGLAQMCSFDYYRAMIKEILQREPMVRFLARMASNSRFKARRRGKKILITHSM